MKWNDCLNCRHYYFHDSEFESKYSFASLSGWKCKKGHNYGGVLRSRQNAGIQMECNDFKKRRKENDKNKKSNVTRHIRQN
jgi:hypothetical protein